MEFLNQLDPLQKVFWYIALPATLVFLIQSILTFMGTDAGDGTSADFDADLEGGPEPFQLFSFRNLIHFLLGFGWSGIAFGPGISSPFLLLLITTGSGIAFVGVFFLIIRQLMRLSEDNSFRIHETLNHQATVYIPIPPHKSGSGKIQISIRGSIHEISALTAGEKLESGALVRVIKISADNMVEVEKIQ
jgi:hypothetical protein